MNRIEVTFSRLVVVMLLWQSCVGAVCRFASWIHEVHEDVPDVLLFGAPILLLVTVAVFLVLLGLKLTGALVSGTSSSTCYCCCLFCFSLSRSLQAMNLSCKDW